MELRVSLSRFSLSSIIASDDDGGGFFVCLLPPFLLLLKRRTWRDWVGNTENSILRKWFTVVIFLFTTFSFLSYWNLYLCRIPCFWGKKKKKRKKKINISLQNLENQLLPFFALRKRMERKPERERRGRERGRERESIPSAQTVPLTLSPMGSTRERERVEKGKHERERERERRGKAKRGKELFLSSRRADGVGERMLLQQTM